MRRTRSGNKHDSAMARPMVISAVLFDFDGTLTRPHNIDFAAVKQELGCPSNQPVLEFIESITDPKQRGRANELLHRFEMEAAATAQPNLGVENTISELAAMGLPLGVLTRNSTQAITRSFENFNRIAMDSFDVILTRDDVHEPKPHPEGMVKAAALLGVDPAELLCVGDYVFDVQGAQNAGCISAFLTNREPLQRWQDRSGLPDTSGWPSAQGRANAPRLRQSPDFLIDSLGELPDIARLHRRLRMGKLPNDLLMRFLDEFRSQPDGIEVGPSVGEDCAVIDPGDPGLLVLTSDPITFASAEIGHYALTVCANDIVTTGATPKWFLATLLLPVGTTAAEVRAIIKQLHESAWSHHVVLCGGHTEITDAVTRSVIVGQMVGEVAKLDVVRKEGMLSGDRILLTKRVAVEGTAVIAREVPDRLLEMGVSADLVDRAAEFLHAPGISVVAEAQAAASTGGVSAMHDVTEGGLATAVHELSIAGQHGVRIDPDQIPVYPQTAEICRALGLDPLGLIGSGSLLIACRPDHAQSVMRAVEGVDIEVCEIGEVIETPSGVTSPGGWPAFEVDEITRLFGSP